MKKYLVFDVDTKGEKESNLGLDSRKSRVMSIGVKNDEFERLITYSNEAKILQEFWDLIIKGDYTLIGFNCEYFDVPFLYVRSLIKNVKVLNLENRCIDIRHILGNKNTKSKGKLKEFGDSLGFNFCHSGFSKSNVQLLWQGNQILELENRMLEDVRLTYMLFKKMQGVGLV